MQKVSLPDPEEPGSLEAVQRAADNLSGVGKIILETNANATAWFGDYGTLRWDIDCGKSNDEAAAKMFAIVAQHFDSVKVCGLQDTVPEPLLLGALVGWGQMFIESVCFGSEYDLGPFEWEALPGLTKLNTIVFWSKYHKPDKQQHTKDLFQLSEKACIAAERYVVPSGRSLRIEYGVEDLAEDLKGVDAATSCRTSCDQKQDAQSFLSASIKAVLPSGSRLVSIDFSCMEGNKLYTGYGGDCRRTAFWVVVVAPVQPTAPASM